MDVAAIMTQKPVTVQRGTSLDRALDLMDEHDIRHLPVMDDAGLAGVISDRDVLEATGLLHLRQREALEAPESNVGDAMHTPPITVGIDDSIRDALGLFVQSRIGCVPVLRDGTITGMVTEMDILRAYANACRRGHIKVKDDPQVGEHMTREPATISADASGADVAHAMKEANVRHLLVMDGEQMIGIVSDRDVRTVRGRGRLELTLAREFMTPDPETVGPDHQLSSVALILSANRISALPVVADGRVAGIATTIDIMVPCALALQAL